MKAKTVVLAIGCIAILVIPFMVSGFWIRLLTHIFMFCTLSTALNIIAGFTGYAAFGNIMFFGIGAYTTAICMEKVGVPFVVSVAFGAVIAVGVAIGFGVLFLRLRGHYFALASMGAAEAIRSLVDNLPELTGGGQGMTVASMAASPAFINGFFYFSMLGLAAITVGAVWLLSRSRFGYGLMAIRADEEAAGVMGIDTTKYKVMAWSLSALFTAAAGGVYAFWFSYIDPPTVFNVMWVVEMFVIILIGGMGTVFGPVIGAFILQGISEVVWSSFINLHLGILGIMIILVVLFMPKGLLAIAKSSHGIRGFVRNISMNRETRI